MLLCVPASVPPAAPAAQHAGDQPLRAALLICFAHLLCPLADRVRFLHKSRLCALTSQSRCRILTLCLFLCWCCVVVASTCCVCHCARKELANNKVDPLVFCHSERVLQPLMYDLARAVAGGVHARQTNLNLERKLSNQGQYMMEKEMVVGMAVLIRSPSTHTKIY